MILYTADTSHKVLSIMVEASSPYHELYRAMNKVDFERHTRWWRLYIPCIQSMKSICKSLNILKGV